MSEIILPLQSFSRSPEVPMVFWVREKLKIRERVLVFTTGLRQLSPERSGPLTTVCGKFEIGEFSPDSKCAILFRNDHFWGWRQLDENQNIKRTACGKYELGRYYRSPHIDFPPHTTEFFEPNTRMMHKGVLNEDNAIIKMFW